MNEEDESWITRQCNAVADIVYKNQSGVQVIFVILYAILQLGFIIAVAVWPTHIQIIVSIFVLVLTSGFAIEKMSLSIYTKKLETRTAEFIYEAEREKEKILKEYERQIQNELDNIINPDESKKRMLKNKKIDRS
jgi:hypothetical protein